jgi:hypothetical protein
MLEQHILGADSGNDLTGLVSDFNLALIERAAMQQPFAQHFPIAGNRLAPGSLDIGQFLALDIPADIGPFADVEKETGHGK